MARQTLGHEWPILSRIVAIPVDPFILDNMDAICETLDEGLPERERSQHIEPPTLLVLDLRATIARRFVRLLTSTGDAGQRFQHEMEIGDLDDDDPTTHQWVYIALAEKDQATYLVQKACPSKMDQWTNSPALEPGQLRMIAVFPDTDPHHEYVAIDRFRPLKG
jgi:hypothetical protein